MFLDLNPNGQILFVGLECEFSHFQASFSQAHSSSTAGPNDLGAGAPTIGSSRARSLKWDAKTSLVNCRIEHPLPRIRLKPS
ncbi:hypothetical protein V6N13_024521 [Hibiscus sabdariffa]